MKHKGQHLFCAAAAALWCMFMLLHINYHKTTNIAGVAAGAAVMYAVLLFLVKQFGLHKKRK